MIKTAQSVAKIVATWSLAVKISNEQLSRYQKKKITINLFKRAVMISALKLDILSVCL